MLAFQSIEIKIASSKYNRFLIYKESNYFYESFIPLFLKVGFKTLPIN